MALNGQTDNFVLLDFVGVLFLGDSKMCRQIKLELFSRFRILLHSLTFYIVQLLRKLLLKAQKALWS